MRKLITKKLSAKQKALRKKWVAALRSRKFKQTTGTLRNCCNEYCCLGVLCAVAGLPKRAYLGGGYLRAKQRAEFGLGVNDQTDLADMNDRFCSFDEIAAVIENLPDDYTFMDGDDAS